MSELGVIEDTLYIPLTGRIYASEHCPQVLFDQKALTLKSKVPHDLFERGKHNQYTLLASAVRSANIDRYIKGFLEKNPHGIIVQLGCGLETTFYRLNTVGVDWYAIDLPHVIAYRRSLLGESPYEKYIAADVFQDPWMHKITEQQPDRPLLITAAGLFHYFPSSQVITLLSELSHFKHDQSIEITFDAVSSSGMKMLQRKYMKQMGHPHAHIFFSVDSVKSLGDKIGISTNSIWEEGFYRHTNRTGLQLSTRTTMAISDWLNMAKMVYAKLR